MQQLTKKKLNNYINKQLKDNKDKLKIAVIHDYMFGYRQALLDLRRFIEDMYDWNVDTAR